MVQISEDDVKQYIGGVIVEVLALQKQLKVLTEENAKLIAELERRPTPKPPLELVK